MADGGEIAFVFCVLQLDLFFRQPISIDRANQLLVFLQQSLSEFLCFLFVHYVLSVPPRTLVVSKPDMGVYAS